MQGVRKIQVTRENSDDENGEPLSPVARLCHEPGNNLYIIAIIGFKTKINPEVIKANLLRYAPENPRFSCLQVMDKNGVMRWVPTKGDINNHIIEPELNTSPSGDIVEDFIHNLTKSTIDNSKPLWDFHILNVKTSDAESTCIFRLHHSIGDGLSLMSLLLSFTWHQSLVPDQALATVDQAKKSTPKHISISLMKLFLKFLSIFVVAWNTMVDMVSYLASLWFLKDTKTPLSTPSTLGSTGRRIVYKLVSLDDIKLVKNQMGVTVNDVVVGVTQGGLLSQQ